MLGVHLSGQRLVLRRADDPRAVKILQEGGRASIRMESSYNGAVARDGRRVQTRQRAPIESASVPDEEKVGRCRQNSGRRWTEHIRQRGVEGGKEQVVKVGAGRAGEVDRTDRSTHLPNAEEVVRSEDRAQLAGIGEGLAQGQGGNNYGSQGEDERRPKNDDLMLLDPLDDLGRSSGDGSDPVLRRSLGLVAHGRFSFFQIAHRSSRGGQGSRRRHPSAPFGSSAALGTVVGRHCSEAFYM